MTYKEVAKMIEDIGLPAAYRSFPEGTGQEPPFICYYYPSDNDLKADNVNYQKVRDLYIELYTDEKDFAKEEAVEHALNESGLYYMRFETEVESERMYMVTYQTSIVVKEEIQE